MNLPDRGFSGAPRFEYESGSEHGCKTNAAGQTSNKRSRKLRKTEEKIKIK